jgi:hypothetical protein
MSNYLDCIVGKTIKEVRTTVDKRITLLFTDGYSLDVVSPEPKNYWVSLPEGPTETPEVKEAWAKECAEFWRLNPAEDKGPSE